MIYCDVKTCVGCRMCEVACSSHHFGAVSPAMSRIRVAKLEDFGIDMAVTCLSCREKNCMECPTDALSIGEKGEIRLDAGLCEACEQCVETCPIGAVGFFGGLPLFCDLCGGAPACVDICPTRCLAHREDYREIPLTLLLISEENPAQKRARYAEVQGIPLRESWKEGARIDS